MAAAQQEWHNKGSDCCSPFNTCLLSWCLPCIMYGRVNHRLNKDAKLKNWSFFNGSCCGWYALACCGCQWIIQMQQRGDVRQKYGLKGDGCTDCLCACCCGPCDLAQQEKECIYREQERAELIVVQPDKVEGMTYQPAV